MKRILFVVVLVLGCVGCAEHYTTPVAAVAGTADKLEQSGLVILHAAEQAHGLTNTVNGQSLISTAQLDAVALACDKLGRLGTDLAAALNAYNAAKASGGSTVAAANAVQDLVAAASQALGDVGKAVPAGTVQSIDQAVAAALGVYAQLKASAL